MTLLVDAGPLVAILDPSDSYHAECAATFQSLRGELMITTWPCFTEAMHFLWRARRDFSLQALLWDMRTNGRLLIHPADDQDADRVEALMRQYEDNRMDLADASIIAAAERLSLRRAFTIDSGFAYFRLNDGALLQIIR